ALERQIAEQNRLKDIEIANIKATLERQIAEENREKDIQITNIKAALDRQIAHDNREKDLQLADDIEKSTIFNSYLQDISNLLLKNGLIVYDLGSLIMARAKTLMILRQIDPKRKRYLIQFLYDSSIIVSSALANYQQISSSAPSECQLPPIVPNEMIDVGETIISSNQTLDMHGADLSNLAFHSRSRQMLSGIKLTGADFLNASFVRAKLKWSDFSRSSLLDVLYIDSNLSYSLFRSASIVDSLFKDSDARRAIFRQSLLLNTRFVDTILREADFYHAYLVNTTFIRCDLMRTDFSNSHLIHVKFIDCQLRGTDFSFSILEQMDFTAVKMDCVRMTQANLNGSTIDLITDAFDGAILPNGTVHQYKNLINCSEWLLNGTKIPNCSYFGRDSLTQTVDVPSHYLKLIQNYGIAEVKVITGTISVNIEFLNENHDIIQSDDSFQIPHETLYIRLKAGIMRHHRTTIGDIRLYIIKQF
ncbi:unnamed protein product, partial [Didymodactylos carnosus]